MGQATLGIETTTDNPEVIELLKVLHDKDAHIESTIERSFVDTLQGGCQVPIGVKATIVNEDSIRVQAIVGMPDGSESISEDITADIKNYETIGQTLAQTFIDQGAKDLLTRAELVAFK
jgi:hydroxymethylbilane synthase